MHNNVKPKLGKGCLPSSTPHHPPPPFFFLFCCNEPFWLAPHQKKSKLWRLTKIEFCVKICVDPQSSIYFLLWCASFYLPSPILLQLWVVPSRNNIHLRETIGTLDERLASNLDEQDLMEFYLVRFGFKMWEILLILFKWFLSLRIQNKFPKTRF
jgi:hypothetical protein